MALIGLLGLLVQVAFVLALLLRVVDPVATVQIHVLENVQNRQDLAIVWHQRLAHHISGDHQMLQDLNVLFLAAVK